MRVPVCRMFLSMCLGVSPSSHITEVEADVLVFCSMKETVIFLVAVRHFLVILWREGQYVNFNRIKSTSIIITSALLPHLL